MSEYVNRSQVFARFKAWLFALPTRKLIFLALLATYLGAIPNLAYLLFNPDVHVGGPHWGKHRIVSMILFACIIAPLAETAVNQWGCLRLLEKLKCRRDVAVVISAVLFGLAHDYSGPYIVLAFFAGLALASVFVVEDARSGRPFLATATVHALHNGISTVAGLVLLP
jgi:membrane protease YdiL (CAAX protease family)